MKKKLCKQLTAAIMSCVLAVGITGIDITFAADKTAPNKSSIPAECKEVKSDDSMTSAIMSNGDLYCWGYNKYGNIGNGSTDEYQCTPVKILDNVKSVTQNNNTKTTTALTETGDLYCWGYTGYGTVGNGKTKDYYQRTPVKILENIKSVTSDNIMTALTETGTLYWWGNSYYNLPFRILFAPEEVLEDTKFVSTSTYAYDITALTETGDLYCWGNNMHGQAGSGTYEDYHGIPIQVLENVKSITNEKTKAAITETGDLYCWGDNDYGAVGNGSTEKFQRTPVKVLENVESVISGSTMKAITKTGDLYCWGRNDGGEVGNGSVEEFQRTPVKVLENVRYVTEDSWPTVAITETGDLYCWGYTGYGKIGSELKESMSMPMKVLENVKFADGNYHAVTAVTETGDLYCWGTNWYGAVGNGSDNDQFTPVKILGNVKFITSADINSVDGFGYIMSAVTETGDLYCWGANWHGEVGNGSKDPQLTPVKVLENIKSVTSGKTMTAITETGELYCWGKNDYGTVGNGTTEHQLTPVRIFPSGEPVPAETTKPEETTEPAETTKPDVTTEPTTTATPEVTIEPAPTAALEKPTPVNVNVGEKFTIADLRYTVDSATGKKAVKFIGGKKTAKSIVIPSSVRIEGADYKVLSISDNACKNYKKLQKLTIGTNVESIGKNAFSGCKKLKEIIFKTKGLTAGKIGSKAFKGVSTNVKIEAPDSRVKAYKKIVASKR